MANTPKIKRRWVKEEKQIVYLLYRKGFIVKWKLSDLYWESYHWYNRKYYKSKKYTSDGKKYRYGIYMPEVHFCTVDYWGESDEHSLVDSVLEGLYWEHIDTKNWDSDSGEYPQSTFPRMDRKQLIHYLKKLPTKINNNKINKIIKRVSYYD
jgi:hypothetical protein